jgi:hypothetical protein
VLSINTMKFGLDRYNYLRLNWVGHNLP